METRLVVISFFTFACFAGTGLAWKFAKVTHFSWENCGGGKDPAVIKSLYLKPDPIDIPGDLKVSVTGSTSVVLSSPITVNLTLEKKVVGVWVRIPCEGNIGSCVYKDVCSILDDVIPPGQDCPEPLFAYGIPCHCPFKMGVYTLPETDFYVPDVELPYWLTNGDYKATGYMTTNSQELACVKVSFSLTSS
ncbi:ganglioside GM2 activator [Protopterus annectens]|uniref:ganglioside GM2 activator n=1 Tax=Protopterus annectens TaxID=7888 RepID=UPI001CF999E7|nr:ganglioside GM2 activator [Protopterus annectens]